MAKFSELPGKTQVAMIVGGAVALTVGFYFLQLRSMTEANGRASAALQAKQRENNVLRPYRDKEKELEQKIAALQQQLEILKKIVPDEKEVDQFMHIMQATANSAGVEIRRYTSKPLATHEFYTEAPFEMDIDGPYYSVLNFFARTGKLERIINVGGLQMASVKKPGDAKVRKAYQYAPSESVVVSCVTTTFFSRENTPPAPPKPANAPPAGAPPASVR
ncbi:MAG TPA: type 4a pilus biogenesis protein PilO [Terriglobales bacterium]|jgi:type IV pilus assembly protein PilO|nr:type 4a pilus biogenesis protein PilO [Terriglobales bacterium]